MCGIAGFNWEDRELAGRMADMIAHRGPDADGVWVGSGVSFGHRRLSIIDLSALGVQPMANDSGHLHITYNGEVYNSRRAAPASAPAPTPRSSSRPTRSGAPSACGA